MTTQTIHIIRAHNGMEIVDTTMYATKRLKEMERYERRWKREFTRNRSFLQKLAKKIRTMK